MSCSTSTSSGNAKSPNETVRTSFRNGGDTLNYSLSTNSSRKVAGVGVGTGSGGGGGNGGIGGAGDNGHRAGRLGSASFGRGPSYLSVPTEEERNSSPFEEEEEIELEMVMILDKTSQETSLRLERDNCFQNEML